MTPDVRDLIRRIPLFRRVSQEDRAHLAAMSAVRTYDKGAVIFSEADPADEFFTLVDGRVKVFKMTPGGRDVILEIFGPGDPLGTVAVFEERPYPASAVCLEPTTCLVLPRAPFFALMEKRPSMVRGLLSSLTRRLVELSSSLAVRSGGRVETRFARIFVKLAGDLGEPVEGGLRIPLGLSRGDLAALAGTTVETSIRIMSRWGKEGVVATEKDAFLVRDLAALEDLAR